MGSLTGPIKLPIIDLSKNGTNPDSSSWKYRCDQVRQTLEDYGCFIATFEGLSSELRNNVFESMEELFNLPSETKLRLASTKPYHGYTGPMPGMTISERLGLGDAEVLNQTQSYAKVLWPQGNDKFSENITKYTKLTSELEQLVKRMVFESYGVEKYLDSMIQSSHYLCALLKYRPPMKDEGNVGAVPHTDKSFLTILHQNGVNGLEVKTKDGQWFDVGINPHSFVVMAGEALTAWSNGRIHSAEHKVVITSEDKTRYSLGTFSFDKGMIDVPEELIDDEKHPRQFKSFDHMDLLKYYLTGEGTIKTYCGV